MIQNASFESPGGTSMNAQACELGTANYAVVNWGEFTADGWNRDTRVWYVTDRTGTATFPDGDYAYRIDGSATHGNPGGDKLWQTGIRLTAGQMYLFTVAAWSESATASAALDVNMVQDGTPHVLLDDAVVKADGAWETLSARFVPPMSGEYALELFRDTGGHHVWVDDLSLLPATNLVVNGSFELPGGTGAFWATSCELGSVHLAGTYWGELAPSGWQRDDRAWYGTAANAGDTAEFPDGEYACRLDARFDLGGADRVWQTGIPLRAGASYLLSVDAWTERAADGVLDAALVLGSSTNHLLDDTVVIYDGDWQTCEATFTPIVSGSYSLEFFRDSASGENHTWIDNVRLTQVPDDGTILLVR